ncbi:ABC transporter permease subunit [Gallaecimonas pentaromativorans]|uniref:Cationic peptide transport system permease protein n=1 Tax=Gallaecimonas pentaromativorans TaxID=584787 RepID=A0A3N1PNW1_9GAMM|nr:ABC transporter permease subunit [Gallaecimonas pentaromativorans]MED5524089.1 ABC transporter permease subunit [Pseudomonadota bacterium]ROQ29849.1 cationic peptide transport system permease protein [Gallaecimonas pentaromativorans]
MQSPNLYAEERIPSPLVHTWRAFRKSPQAMVGLYIIAALLLAAIFGPWLAPFDPQAQHPDALLVPPSWAQNGHVDYFVGTDDLGRDLLSRLLFGARLTFGSALLVVTAASVLGVVLGAISGTLKGLQGSILHHFLDTLLSIPSVLLAIFFVAIQGPGLGSALIAVWLALVPQFVRVTHDAVASEMEKEYVVAARLDGVGRFRLLWDVILPNVGDAIVHQYALGLSAAVLDISALGFLNLGAQAPLSEWGTMLAGATDLAYLAPWTITLPGVAIITTVIAINLVGDGLRQALNARMEQ